jgi:AAA family ATP:ADP antiporter
VVIRRVVDIRPGELFALLTGWLCFFCLLASYSILRPIRDEIGVAGATTLFWLVTLTLAVMLAANPLLGWIFARLPLRRSITITYRFFLFHLLVFFFLVKTPETAGETWLRWTFFVWTNVFVLFIVSMFWALMVDGFSHEQGKRLFAFVAMGGTLGAVAGSLVTAALVQRLGSANLFLVSAVLLEGSVQCIRFILRRMDARSVSDVATSTRPLGGSAWAGFRHAARSRYYLAICGFVLLLHVGSMYLYSQQALLLGTAYTSREDRTAFLARCDLAVNILSVLGETLVAARLLKWLGVGVTLSLLPALSVIGFLAVGVFPLLLVVALFNVLHRSVNFALTRPARELLFTLVNREDKYKVKALVDTFVHRAGDQVGSSLFLGYRTLGVAASVSAWVTAAISGLWLALAVWLGRQESQRAAREELATANLTKSRPNS